MGCFDRRRLRRWAASVLGVWLAAVVAGIAHACVPPSSGPVEAERATIAVAAPSPHLHQAKSGADSYGPETAAQVSCSRFCDGEPSSVPFAKLPSDPWSHGTLPPPPAAWAVSLRPADAGPTVAAGATAQPARRLPVAIAFLRLIL